MASRCRRIRAIVATTFGLIAVATYGIARQRGTMLHAGAGIIPLDAEIQIQSAARIGGRVLAVWGSTSNAQGPVRHLLYAQLIVDAVPQAMPFIITSPAADPFGRVSITALDDRFLVAWNDRREGAISSVRTRSVDTLGSLGDEDLLADNGTLDIGSIPAVRTASGYRLFWTLAGRQTMQARDVDAAGHPMGAVLEVNLPQFQKVVRVAAHPEYAAAFDGRAMVLIDTLGEWHPAPVQKAVAAGRTASLADDGRVLIGTDNVVGIVYASPLDTTPVRTMIAPYGSWESRWLNSAVSSWDRNGHVRISHFATSTASFGGDVTTTLYLVTYTEDSSNSFGEPARYPISSATHRDHCYTEHAYLHDIKVSQPCADQILLTYTIDHQWIFDCGGIHQEHLDTTYGAVPFTPESENMYAQPSAECEVYTPSHVRIDRMPDTARSHVRLALDTLVIDLYAPAAVAGVEAFVPVTASIASIVPNPARDEITIALAGPLHHDGVVCIVDNIGRVVRAAPLDAGMERIVFDTSTLAAGVYMITMEAEGKMLGLRKAVIVH